MYVYLCLFFCVHIRVLCWVHVSLLICVCVQERRMRQQREALMKEKETSEKVAARAFAQVRRGRVLSPHITIPLTSSVLTRTGVKWEPLPSLPFPPLPSPPHVQGYLTDLVPSVFSNLSRHGFFYDTVERGGASVWMCTKVYANTYVCKYVCM